MISKFYDLLDILYFKHEGRSPRKALLDFVSGEKPMILEVCIGTGANSIAIAENKVKADIVGVDLSKEMLALAREKMERRGIHNVKTMLMDATSMDFEDNSFDVIIISLVLHEVNASVRDKILNEAKRVLKGTGRLLIIEWDQPHRPIQRLMFSIIKAMEPKGFKEFLQLNIDEYVEKFSLEVLHEKKCDYTRVYEISKKK
jgi:demethylmenaquinone methyltransferase/2-methoxy-6-polyprenyl-1,4-benzoquinol methylase